MNRQKISEVCECLRKQTQKMLKTKQLNPYFTPTIYRPLDVKPTFEGLNIINIIKGGNI